MARKPRIEYKGCLYHVMARGNNGEFILLKDEEKQTYLSLVKKYKEKYPFRLYAYCIMDNHIHMLIEQEEVPLSKIMQGIQQSFTQRYNRKYRRTGHVFQQRYKAQICNKDEYLFQLIKYIHMNPKKAKMKEGLDYKWSSHREYIAKGKSELINKEYILGLFSNNKRKAVTAYKKYMNIEDKENSEIERYLLEEVPSQNRSQSKEKEQKNLIKIDEIIKGVCKLEKVNIQEITKRSKIQKYSDIRKAIVLLSESYANVTNTELAEKLNIPLSMVSKIKSRSSKGTEYVVEVIRRAENKGIFQA